MDIVRRLPTIQPRKFFIRGEGAWQAKHIVIKKTVILVNFLHIFEKKCREGARVCLHCIGVGITGVMFRLLN